MGNYCSTTMRIKGEVVTQFEELKKMYGYPMAYDIIHRITTPAFLTNFSQEQLDKNGIPTFKAIITNQEVQRYIGEEKIKEGLKKKYPDMEDTKDNFISLVNSAQAFNKENPFNDQYIAIVDNVEDGKIGITFLPYNEQNAKIAQEQVAVLKVNQKLSELFNPIGITVENLYEAEGNAGKVGVTDFSKASRIGNDFVSIIRIADTKLGYTALSEEFSHLIIGALRDNPIIQRSLQALRDNQAAVLQILGEDEYNRYKTLYSEENGDEVAEDMLAEEALGKILQNEFISNEMNETGMFPILKRVKGAVQTSINDCIISTGKQPKEVSDEILKTISDAELAMSDIVKDIIDGTLEINKEQIQRAQSMKQFYSLAEQIDKNIDILKKAKDIELKRYKIINEKKADDVKDLISKIDKYANKKADTAYGVLLYAKDALETLTSLRERFEYFDRLDTKGKFKFLRTVKSYIDSYAGFINEMAKALDEASMDDENVFDLTYTIGSQEYNVQDIIKELNFLSKQLTEQYAETAITAFTKFMSNFIGTEIVVPFGKNKGKKIKVDELIKEAETDISFIDRWLMSMTNSSDILLQGFAKVVGKAKDSARKEFIDFREDINRFREKCESLGIKDFEWAFEKDDEGNKTGNYIGPLNFGQFEKDYKKLLEDLDEKYGVNPSGDEARAKLKERDEWIKEHAKYPYITLEPNQTYRNAEYDSLSQTQKDVLDEFLKLKMKMDKLYPENRTGLFKAIQKRKSSSERFWESATSPKTLIENIQESFKEEFFSQEDDDKIFGDRTTKGITNFDGSEYMMLPVLYTSRLKNPNELSTDLIGTLYAYSYCAIEYKHMDKVVDALEVGQNIVSEHRKYLKKSGDKQVKEKISALGLLAEFSSKESNAEYEKKLRDFMETQVYQRYLKDAGNFGDSLVSKQKTVSFILKVSSIAQMGFNFLAQTANIANGIAMQNIEAVAGQFFGVKELAEADAEYMKQLPKAIAESAARDKTGKLALFDELINFKGEFKTSTTRLRTRNLLKRLFGADIAYLGQTAGDHWLYNRTAIAMAKREKVLVNGQEKSLWDAMQVSDVEGSTTLKKIDMSNIKNLDGSSYDIAAFGRKVLDVNQRLFGIYNDEDLAAAHRTMLGRLALQYRKWMVPLYSNRFQSARYNAATDTWHEGFYITTGRVIKELFRGKYQLLSLKSQLEEDEWYNVKRALTEVVQFAAVWAMAALIDWPDDKNRPWALKMAEYIVQREKHELGGLVPSSFLLQESMKTFQSPFPSIREVDNAIRLLVSLRTPEDYTNEISSGPYKGMSTLEKNFMKAPFPIVAQYRQVNKLTKNIETGIDFYVRPY